MFTVVGTLHFYRFLFVVKVVSVRTMITNLNHILRRQLNKLAFLKAELSDLNLTLRTETKHI